MPDVLKFQIVAPAEKSPVVRAAITLFGPAEITHYEHRPKVSDGAILVRSLEQNDGSIDTEAIANDAQNARVLLLVSLLPSKMQSALTIKLPANAVILGNYLTVNEVFNLIAATLEATHKPPKI